MGAVNRTYEEKPVHAGGGGPGRVPGDRGFGGGGDNSGSDGYLGPRARLRRYRIGLALGLVCVLMLFAALTSAYVVRQGTSTIDLATGMYRQNWTPLRLPGLLWVNTVILLLSSLTIEMARRASLKAGIPEVVGIDSIRTGKSRLPWLGITLVLGCGFLAGQVLAWMELNRQGIFLATYPSSSFFFMLTGMHALHLAGGMLSLCGVALTTLMGRPLESRQIALDLTSWYWHVMGVIWLYVFGLLYFFA